MRTRAQDEPERRERSSTQVRRARAAGTRLVTTATALMKPRLEDTFTLSPALMPSSWASASPISTNCSGCSEALISACLVQ